MLADPLLIRRPLMEIDGRKTSGFNVDQLKEWIHLTDPKPLPAESCPRTDEKSCK